MPHSLHSHCHTIYHSHYHILEYTLLHIFDHLISPLFYLIYPFYPSTPPFPRLHKQNLATQLSNNLNHEEGKKNGLRISSLSNGGKSSRGVLAGRVEAFPYPLEWNNVLAANCYQLLCRSLLLHGRKRDLRLNNVSIVLTHLPLTQPLTSFNASFDIL